MRTATSEGQVLVLPIDELRKIMAEAERQGVDLHEASAEYAANVTGRASGDGDARRDGAG